MKMPNVGNVDSDPVCGPRLSPCLLLFHCVIYAMHASVYLCLSALCDSIWWLCGLYEVTMPSVLTLCNI